MRLTMPTLLAFAAATLTSVGCDNEAEQNRLTLLEQENTELRTQLDDRGQALDAANTELMQANKSIRQQADDFATEAATWQEQQVGSFDNIEGVTATYGPNDVTIAVEGDVLFDSGRISLKNAAKSSLNRVIDVIRAQYPGSSIIVAGHTDTDPIRKSGHKSNYHLGFERGWAVRNYLKSKGIDGGDIAVMSYGPDRPMSSSKQSRRVEIVVAQ
jgi:chemotaxis protein MotB